MRNEVNNWSISWFLYTNLITMYWLIYTNLQNKTQYRRAVLFTRSQKGQHKYIVSKRLSGLETFPNN